MNNVYTSVACNTSTINGYKFSDINGNGTWGDPDEPRLPGWIIILTGSDSCTSEPIKKTTITNDTGYFEFKGITAGSYVLSEIFQVGWEATTPPIQIVKVPSTTTTISKNFGNKRR